MRQRLLGVAEMSAWVAVSFAAFLALRVLSILLNLVNLAQCTDSCEAGSQALPIVLLAFGVGWFPAVLVYFVRLARRGPSRWWIPHAAVVVLVHMAAMVLLVRIFAQFSDADTRTAILALSAAASDLLTGLLLLLGAGRQGQPAPGAEEQQA